MMDVKITKQDSRGRVEFTDESSIYRWILGLLDFGKLVIKPFILRRLCQYFNIWTLYWPCVCAGPVNKIVINGIV